MTIEELIQSELNIYDNLDNNDILNYTRKCTKHRILLLKRLYPLTDFCQKEMPLNLKQELRALLQHLIALENDYINSIKKAKNRDTIRGSTIIPDYILVNKFYYVHKKTLFHCLDTFSISRIAFRSNK